MLDELLTVPGVQERFSPGSRFGFCALHGGLEQGTAEVAVAAADRAGASFYAVVQPPDFRWHVPSHRYDVTHSDLLAAFVDRVDVVISVHGYGGLRNTPERWTTALLGGRNRELAESLGRHLHAALPHYRWVTDLDLIPKRLRGLHPANPVNAVVGGGVQIELPPRVRRPGDDFEALVNALAAAGAGVPRRCNAGAGSDPVSTPPR